MPIETVEVRSEGELREAFAVTRQATASAQRRICGSAFTLKRGCRGHDVEPDRKSETELAALH